MNRYEKQSFIQIFLGYFISISIFIILLGYLYFHQQKNFILQTTAMNMHQFILKLKHSKFTYKQPFYSFEIVKKTKVERALPTKIDNYYYKAFSNHIIIKAESSLIDKQINHLLIVTVSIQACLIIFFGILSYILTKQSLRPMVETISHFDRFTKDLVHDLNTPVTSILINTNMLTKTATPKQLLKIQRIETSAKDILALYANLEVILDENNLSKSEIDIQKILTELIDRYRLIYPQISFDLQVSNPRIYSNIDALKRILDNIISNSCKYSKQNQPFVKIEVENGQITIIDNGKGIKYPKKIFERNYKENTNGHGIGMHIVHRLCYLLDINIQIESKEDIGTKVVLKSSQSFASAN